MTRRRLLRGQFGTATRPSQTAPRSTTSSKPPAAFRWLGKASFGVAPGDLSAFNALGGNDNARWAAWVSQQLDPATIADTACEARIVAAGYQTLGKTLPQLWADHHEGDPAWWYRMLPQEEVEAASIVRAVYSRRQLYERMVGFWHNHFNVYSRDGNTAPVFVHYDRDVIRPHALGNFRNMLGQVARSTAMLYYLDNYDSRGANFNENYARELIELHTLGVENYFGPGDPFNVPCVNLSGHEIHCPGDMPAGYVDNDIYEAAAALTGWTVKNGHWEFPNENDGTFIYRPGWHQHNNKIFLGLWMPANQPDMLDGEMVFDRLCQHPGTARHVAGKLCRHFVGESASASLIDSVAAVFAANLTASNQIALMLQTLLQSAEFKAAWDDGMKPPFRTCMSALRALDADFTPLPDNTNTWTTTESFLSALGQTGNRPFRWQPPNGYPDTMQAWASSGALAMTLRMLESLPDMRQVRGDDTSPYLADIVAQTKAAIPDPAQRTAGNIVNFWAGRLHGWQPQPLTGIAMAFMQQNAAANEPLDLDSEQWETGDLKNHYVQSRLRATVAMLLMSPDFLRR